MTSFSALNQMTSALNQMVLPLTLRVLMVLQTKTYLHIYGFKLFFITDFDHICVN